MNFEQLVDQTKQMAASQVPDGELIAAIHTIDADGKTRIHACLDVPPRDILPMVLESDPIAYSLYAEARMRSWGNDEPRPADSFGYWADNPEFPEIVIVVASPRGGPVELWQALIHEGRVLGDWELQDDGKLSGALAQENW